MAGLAGLLHQLRVERAVLVVVDAQGVQQPGQRGGRPGAVVLGDVDAVGLHPAQVVGPQVSGARARGIGHRALPQVEPADVPPGAPAGRLRLRRRGAGSQRGGVDDLGERADVRRSPDLPGVTGQHVGLVVLTPEVAGDRAGQPVQAVGPHQRRVEGGLRQCLGSDVAAVRVDRRLVRDGAVGQVVQRLPGRGRRPRWLRERRAVGVGQAGAEPHPPGARHGQQLARHLDDEAAGGGVDGDGERRRRALDQVEQLRTPAGDDQRPLEAR